MYPYLMVLGIIQCFEDHGYHPVCSQMHSEAGHGALGRQADYTGENELWVSTTEMTTLNQSRR